VEGKAEVLMIGSIGWFRRELAQQLELAQLEQKLAKKRELLAQSELQLKQELCEVLVPDVGFVGSGHGWN
jgi:hypothetical protein